MSPGVDMPVIDFVYFNLNDLPDTVHEISRKIEFF